MLRVTIVLMLAKLGSCLFDNDLHEKYLTMPYSEFVEHFNNQNLSWKIGDFGRDMPLVGSHIDYDALERIPFQEIDTSLLRDLPVNFDAREQWPNCESIQRVYDQGQNCGSCWTFGTADTASDRTCIHLNINVNLAEQDFQCLKNYVCKGGDAGQAFEFWKSNGLVTQSCKPYDIAQLEQGGCIKQCVNPSIDYAQDKHYANQIYRINSNDDEIKSELFRNGPIQATFQPYKDFQTYTTGVYEHAFGEKLDFMHSVRVIGYGVENGKDYWLIVNSWGTVWGENGIGKVRRFAPDLYFENTLLTGLPRN